MIASWKVTNSTFRTGFTASEIRDATMRLMFFSPAISTILCVMMPSKTTVSTPLTCCSFSANWLTGKRSINSNLSFSKTASSVPSNAFAALLTGSGTSTLMCCGGSGFLEGGLPEASAYWNFIFYGFSDFFAVAFLDFFASWSTTDKLDICYLL